MNYYINNRVTNDKQLKKAKYLYPCRQVQMLKQILSYNNTQENYGILILSKKTYNKKSNYMNFNPRSFSNSLDDFVHHFSRYLKGNRLYEDILMRVYKDFQCNHLYNESFPGKEILESLIKFEVIPNNLSKENIHLYDFYREKMRKLTILENQYMFHVLLESMLYNKIDKIMTLTNKLMRNNLSEKILFIKKDKTIIGKKIVRSSHLLPDCYKSDRDNWVPVWHGTKFEVLESIMDLGLKLPGTILKDGTVIKPLSNHIKRNITIDNIDDWANGIFVSQSIFYSTHKAYANVIQVYDKDWIVLVEGRAKIGKYYSRRHTFGNIENYKLLEGEPEDVEFRIEKESDIIVVSILFVDKNYIRQIKKYKEGAIFANIDFEEKNQDNLRKYDPNEEIEEIIFYKNIKEEECKVCNPNFIFGNEIKDYYYHKEMKPYKKNIKYKKCKFYDEYDSNGSDKEEDIENKEIIINSIKYRMKYFPRKEIYIESNILKGNIVYQQKLIQWLKKPNKSLESNILKDIKLLYRGSRDGFKSSVFHDKCDNQGHTLVIIESTDFYIFGGYSSIEWESITWNGKCGKENNARRKGLGYEFVFTLKNPHDIPPCKFNMKKEWLDHSICCDVKLGPIFGCNDIRIQNNCDEENNYFTYYDFTPGEYCFDDTTGKKRKLFTGNSTYKVKEIEVFQISHSFEHFNLNKSKKLKKNYYDYDYK